MNKLEPFWPAGLSESDKGRRLRDWEAQIFPIWKGIVTREEKALGEKIENPDGDLLRRLDIAIWESARKPDRSSAKSEGMDRARRGFQEAMQ